MTLPADFNRADYVIRRIPVGSMSRGVTSAGSFSPSDNDTTGLSVYDAAFTSSREAAQTFRRMPGGKPAWAGYILKTTLTELGLTLVSDPINEDGFPPEPGHMLIPEIKTSTKATTIAIRKKLAEAVILDEEFPPQPLPVPSVADNTNQLPAATSPPTSS